MLADEGLQSFPGCPQHKPHARSVNTRACLIFLLPRFLGRQSSLPEEPRREIVQTSAPCQPLMGGTRRLEVHVVDAGLRQRLTESLRTSPFHGTYAQEEHLDLLVECGRIREHAVAGGLRIESAPAAAAAAEAADVGELVEIGERGREGLHTAHRQSGHGTVLAAGKY